MMRHRTLIYILLAFIPLMGPLRGEPSPAGSGEEEGPVVVFGNSIAEGYIGGEIDTVSRYSNLLRQDLSRLGHETRVINAGKGGNTSRDGYLRLDEDVLRFEPSVVTISFGLNDLRLSEDGTPGVDIGDFRLYLDAIVERVRGSGASPVLLSIMPIVPDRFYETHDRSLYAPVGGVEALWSDYDEMVRSVGSENGLDVVDLLAGFSDSVEVLVGEEGTHANERGHRVIADLLLSPVTRGLEAPAGDVERPSGEGIQDIRLFPNPFPPEPGRQLRIAYRTTGEGRITVEIYSLTGSRVAVPVKDLFRIPGDSIEFWDGKDADGTPLPPGVYLVRIAWNPATGAKPGHQTRKVAIIR